MNSLNTIQERVPLLLSQARTRAADRKAAEASLHFAERILYSTRHSRVIQQWQWNHAAEQIAKTWYFITADADRTEYCLRTLVGHENTAHAWTEMASSLRIALGAKWFERTWDSRTRKYLIMAEEAATTCRHWCVCAYAWQSESDDYERALSCLLRAKGMASTFLDFFDCAISLRFRFKEYGWLKLKTWAAEASARAVTSSAWLMCANLVAEVDEFESKRCLAEAEERAGTFDGHIECAFKVDQLLGARGLDSVLRCLTRAEQSSRGREDWCRQVLTGYGLRHRAEHIHEPVCGVANLEAFDTYYKHCLQRFRDTHPKTQDWLRLVRGIRWITPDTTDVDFMLSAESTARSAHDWMECAAAWSSLKLPAAKINASICRLRASRKEKALRFLQ